MDGLAAGTYSIRVELGDWYDEPRVLGETRAAVVEGERTSATLHIEPAPPTVRVPFAGTLVLPEDWALADFELGFERVGRNADGSKTRFRLRRTDMEPRGGLLLWTAPDAPSGRYEVELEALAYAALIELPDGGTMKAQVVVPSPCDVAVRCIDADTGAVATGVELHWCAEIPGVRGRRDRVADWDADGELWRFRAPVGGVVLGVYGGAYDPAPAAHAVQPGRNEIVLRLSRVCELFPVLRCDGTAIPWDDDFGLPTLEPLEGQAPGQTLTYIGDDMGVMIRGEPGLYRLVVPPIDGYEPVPDEDVRLAPGEAAEQVIELRRSHR
jgi:hypothetical protein